MLLNKRISYNSYYADSEEENSYFRYKTLPIMKEVLRTLGENTSKRIETTMESINYHYQHRALINKRLDSYNEFRERIQAKIDQLSESPETIQLVNEFELKDKTDTKVEVKVEVDKDGVVKAK